MCVCNPDRRTPFCGAIGCQWPKDKKKEIDREPATFEENKELFKKVEKIRKKLKEQIKRDVYG